MSSDRKPVWLEEDAHLILKQYAKLAKTSMTEVTSQLVLEHLTELDETSGVELQAGASAAAEAPAVVAAPEAPAEAEDPNRYVETSEETRLEPPRPEPPAPPRRERAPRKDDGEVRYLGGVWLL